MDLSRGDVVRSLAGHDKGTLYCVTGIDGGSLLLADGKGRTLERPKRKRCKHVCRAGRSDHPVFRRLRAGERVGARELRRALAAFRDERDQEQSRRE